jgi:flagellin
MSMVIGTNSASITAQRHLASSRVDMETAMERLASGSRINSAQDDAAGLAIAGRMDAEVNGLNQAVRNGNDGIAFLQTIEGAMEESTNILQRMRQLGVQGAQDTLTTADRTAITAEMADLMLELTRIDTATTFNNTVVFSTSSTTTNIAVDADGANLIAIAGKDVSKVGLGLSTTSIVVTTAAEATSAVTKIDAAIAEIAVSRSDYGSKANRLQFAVSNLMNVSEHVSAARSGIQDTDYAAESANLAKAQVLQQAGTAMLSQANASTQNVLSLLK